MMKYDRGWIYFIRRGSDGPLKIGFSTNVDNRILSLQTACAEKLELIGKVPGSLKEEQHLHRQLRRIGMQDGKYMGEWYLYDKEFVDNLIIKLSS